jgi:hypothetical protein
MNRRRLDFEALRDSLLAVAGGLDRTLGGPPVKDMTAPAAHRRTVYGFIDRLNLPGLFRTFDFPSPDTTSPRRDITTVAPQALFLMNNPFMLEQARKVLRRPEIMAAKEWPQRVVRLYRLLYGREPSREELALAEDFLKSPGDKAALAQRYVQALLLTNEFAFAD